MIDESEKACNREMDFSRDGMALGRSATESPTSRTMRTPPPSAASASSDNRVLTRGLARLTPLNLQVLFIYTEVHKVIYDKDIQCALLSEVTNISFSIATMSSVSNNRLFLKSTVPVCCILPVNTY